MACHRKARVWFGGAKYKMIEKNEKHDKEGVLQSKMDSTHDAIHSGKLTWRAGKWTT